MLQEVAELRSLTESMHEQRNKRIDVFKSWIGMLNNIPNLMFIIDTSNIIRYANKALAKTLGTGIKELLGADFKEVEQLNDVADYFCKDMEEAYKDGILTVGNNKFKYSCTPIDDNGELLGFICILDSID
jgi:PAS domain S-box-containing protein